MTTIVTRAGKGSALTWTEGDANLTNLNNDKIELTNLSVSTGAATGGGALSYSNLTGVFTFAPADLSGLGGINNVVEDTTPQLGGNLDVQNYKITTSTNNTLVIEGKLDQNVELIVTGTGEISLTPGASGGVNIDGLAWPANDGTAGQYLKTDGAGTLSWQTLPAAGITQVADDTSPSLGGNLDTAGSWITNTDPSSLTIQGATNYNVEIFALGTGDIKLMPAVNGDSVVQRMRYDERVYSLGTTNAPTIDPSNGNVQTVTITSGLALPAFTGASAGQSVTLIVTGSGNATGTAAYKFAGGSKTLTNFSVVSIFYDGTTYWTSIATDFQA